MKDVSSGMHLFFFECINAKGIWSMIAFAFGVTYRPVNFEQYWIWINRSLPQGRKVYMVGLAAICCAIWLTRNKICFDNKRVNSPAEIICIISSFLSYWSTLQKQEFALQMEVGARSLKKMALSFHHLLQRAEPKDEPLMISYRNG